MKKILAFFKWLVYALCLVFNGHKNPYPNDD